MAMEEPMLTFAATASAINLVDFIKPILMLVVIGLYLRVLGQIFEKDLRYFNLKAGVWNSIFLVTACLAIVAVLETLVSAEIAGARAGYDYDDKKEALMVAVAHLVCGCLGALPPTGVFVRTSINQSLGANHRISQFMNAIMVLIVTAVALPVARTAVAAVLQQMERRVHARSECSAVYLFSSVQFSSVRSQFAVRSSHA